VKYDRINLLLIQCVIEQVASHEKLEREIKALKSKGRVAMRQGIFGFLVLLILQLQTVRAQTTDFIYQGSLNTSGRRRMEITISNFSVRRRQ
jgi:hypothetical protein